MKKSRQKLAVDLASLPRKTQVTKLRSPNISSSKALKNFPGQRGKGAWIFKPTLSSIMLVGAVCPYARLFIQRKTFPENRKNYLYIPHKQLFVKTAKNDQRKISHFEQIKFKERSDKTTLK